MQTHWKSRFSKSAVLSLALIAVCAMLAFTPSGCVSNLSTKNSVEELPQPEPIDTLGIPIERLGMSVYNPAGLRKEPGKKDYTSDGEKNYITGIYYGEMVEVVDTPAVEVENKKNIKVRLKGGEEGWTHDFLIERYARRAVMTGEAELYRRPDMMTLRGDELTPGQIIAVLKEDPDYPEWLHVSSFEKRKKGWIRRENNLTFDPDEVQVAMRFYRATKIYRADKRLEALSDLLRRDMTANSAFRSMIEAEYEEMKSRIDPKLVKEKPYESGEDKLFITQGNTWLRPKPDPSDEQGILQLTEDEICVILARGDRDTIGEMADHWYHVRHNGQEGWVFGYYTSRRDLD